MDPDALRHPRMISTLFPQRISAIPGGTLGFPEAVDDLSREVHTGAGWLLVGGP